MTSQILIVEDDLGIRNMLSAVIRHQGLTPVVAADGASGLALLAHGSYAALILDLLLPAVSGFDILRHLKMTAPAMLKNTIVVTAAAESTLGDCAELGLVRAVMQKPMEISFLCDSLRACEALKAERGTQAPAISIALDAR